MARPRMGPERRDAIVRAAFQRIATQGFEGLRLRDVAAEVGMDHSSIHHHFPTKQDLVTAVVEYATRQFWATTPEEGTPEVRLRGHLASLARMIEERPDLHIVLRELDLRATRDQAVREVVEASEAGWRRSLVQLVGQEAKAELVIATVKGASLRPETAGIVLTRLEELLT